MTPAVTTHATFEDKMTPEEITQKIEALEQRATELLDKAKSEPADAKSVQDQLADHQKEINLLREERKNAEQDAQVKGLEDQVSTMKKALDEMRKPLGLPFSKSVESSNDDNPYADGKHSFFADIKAANKGRQDAIQRLSDVQGKAITETTIGGHTDGGYLVQPQVQREFNQARELDNVLRGLCTVVNVQTDELQFEQASFGTTAGWVAELATKPEGTSLTNTSVSVRVHTAAGLVTVSNQLLADARPAVDGLIATDLAKRIVALEETAFLRGTGTTQPLGILNTPGVATDTITATAVRDLIVQILTTIATVEDNHGAPTAILMHPRTWTRIITAADTNGAFLIESDNDFQDPRTGLRGPRKSLWGYPVVTSNRVPTNLGAGTNQSAIVVGDFREALVLDREGFRVDESPHVYFTTNQTVFRGEARVGFTAARNTAAFRVIGGAGLANG